MVVRRTGDRPHGDDSWLADVGFGGGLLEPMPWADTGTTPTPVRQGGWTYRLVTDTGGTWQLQEQRGHDWDSLYSFTHERQHASDIAMANHYTSTDPSSPFIGRQVVMRRDSHTRHRLLGRQLDVVYSDGTSDERQLTDTEVADALRDDFALNLKPEDISALIAALPPPSRN